MHLLPPRVEVKLPGTIQPYRRQMPELARNAYDAIFAAAFATKHSVIVRGCDMRSVDWIIKCMLYDNPLVFHVQSWSMMAIGGTVRVNFNYNLQHDEYVRIREQCVAKALSWCKNLTEDIDKELCIHDAIIKNVSYVKSEGWEQHSIVGPLIDGKGVCDGISKTFKLMADIMGLEAGVVAGTSSAMGENEAHAWNKVCILGFWFHLDVTFDLTLGGGLRHDYFNLSDSEIARDHTSNTGSGLEHLPCERSNADYYTLCGAVVSNPGELARYCRNNTSLFKRTLTFKISGLWNPSTDEILNIVNKNSTPHMSVRISSNTAIKVYKVEIL